MGDSLEWVYDLGDWWAHSIVVVAVSDANMRALLDEGNSGDRDRIALLGGARAGIPEDISGLCGFNHKIGRAFCAAHSPVEGRCNLTPGGLEKLDADERALRPDSEKFWEIINDEFRKTNCFNVVYSPMRFKIDDARGRLRAALRERRSRPKDAIGSFLRGGTGPKGTMARNINEASRGSRQVRRSCAVCGITAGVSACSGCGGTFYCSKEHQVEHWKAHKKDCAAAKEAAKEAKAKADEKAAHAEVRAKAKAEAKAAAVARDAAVAEAKRAKEVEIEAERRAAADAKAASKAAAAARAAAEVEASRERTAAAAARKAEKRAEAKAARAAAAAKAQEEADAEAARVSAVAARVAALFDNAPPRGPSSRTQKMLLALFCSDTERLERHTRLFCDEEIDDECVAEFALDDCVEMCGGDAGDGRRMIAWLSR